MDHVESEMSSCPMETKDCADAESIVVTSSTISDCFSTPTSSRSIPFCVRISRLQYVVPSLAWLWLLILI
jgi:hypothetical protein